MSFANLHTRLREVLEDQRGTLRTIASSRFLGGLYEDLPDDEKSRRALVTPRAEATLKIVGRNPQSPPIIGSMGLYDIELSVRVVRHMHIEKLDDDTRDASMALAAADGDLIWQAMSYPGNLTQTQAAAATGLLSGCFNSYGGSDVDVQLPDGGPAIIETVHRFGGIIQFTYATS